MSKLTQCLYDGFQTVWPDVQQGLRERYEADIQDACRSEQERNMITAAIAMIDASVSEETVIAMLQKHWDLRLSEATYIFRTAQRTFC